MFWNPDSVCNRIYPLADPRQWPPASAQSHSTAPILPATGSAPVWAALSLPPEPPPGAPPSPPPTPHRRTSSTSSLLSPPFLSPLGQGTPLQTHLPEKC